MKAEKRSSSTHQARAAPCCRSRTAAAVLLRLLDIDLQRVLSKSQQSCEGQTGGGATDLLRHLLLRVVRLLSAISHLRLLRRVVCFVEADQSNRKKISQGARRGVTTRTDNPAEAAAVHRTLLRHTEAAADDRGYTCRDLALASAAARRTAAAVRCPCSIPVAGRQQAIS